MSSALINEQRRIQLKAVQVESLVHRESDRMRKLEGARTRAEKMYLLEKKSYEGVKHALVVRTSSPTHPGQELERVAALIHSLKEKRQALGVSSDAVRALKDKQAEIANGMRIQFKQRELLLNKNKSLIKKHDMVRERREQELSVESLIARNDRAQQQSQTIAPFVSPAEPPSSIEPSKAAPSRYAQGIERLEISDTEERSQVDLTFSNSAGEEMNVELIRKGDRSLEVRLTPQQQGNQRRLWNTRQDILKSLKKAGYSVERFVLSSGGKA